MISRARVLLANLPVAGACLLAAGCAAGAAANGRSPGVIENGAFKPTRASENDVPRIGAEPIRIFASTAQVPRYGLAIQRVKKGVTKLALAMQDQSLEIQPIPRKLSAGQTATLSGKVLGKMVNPKVQYTDATGKLERAEAQSDKSFKTEIKCGERQGRIIVLVAAEKEGT